ncbi:hypothetical protein ATO3_21990 [Marinibacterium profundimaris]|uniref:Solute-binding protein family 3/N-terminal domain-containing protein n=1 Tax=Marinibacterium profundimaris TaxID=1679460 RepID=A0A225NEU8_9RHOB|nr:hypothetical protein ATO3_21990 [Marinibacterium profundimaris]
MRPLASLLLAAAMAVPATAQTVDRIRSEGEIRLGYRQDAAPLSYVDDQGVPAGYTVQVCAQLAQALGRALDLEEIEMTFVPVDTSNRFAKVADGEIDLLCGASTITMSRREFVDFSIPIFVDGTAVMLPVGAETTFSALNGASIGVRSGTTTEEALGNTLTQTGTEAEVVTFDSHEEGLAAMQAGEIAAYFADQSILLFLNAGNRDFMVMDRLLTIEKQGLALPRGDDEFRFLVDGALSGLYNTGVMEGIFRETLPGVEPGQAMQWLFRLGPILP